MIPNAYERWERGPKKHFAEQGMRGGMVAERRGGGRRCILDDDIYGCSIVGTKRVRADAIGNHRMY